MGKKWIWGLILFFVVSITSRLFIRLGEYDYFEGIGLAVLIITAVLYFLIFRVFFSGYFPKTKEDAKKFQYSGSMVGLIYFVLICATLILWVATAYHTFGDFSSGSPLFFKLVLWAIFSLSVFFWVVVIVKALREKKKK